MITAFIFILLVTGITCAPVDQSAEENEATTSRTLPFCDELETETSTLEGVEFADDSTRRPCIERTTTATPEQPAPVKGDASPEDSTNDEPKKDEEPSETATDGNQATEAPESATLPYCDELEPESTTLEGVEFADQASRKPCIERPVPTTLSSVRETEMIETTETSDEATTSSVIRETTAVPQSPSQVVTDAATTERNVPTATQTDAATEVTESEPVTAPEQATDGTTVAEQAPTEASTEEVTQTQSEDATTNAVTYGTTIETTSELVTDSGTEAATDVYTTAATEAVTHAEEATTIAEQTERWTTSESVTQTEVPEVVTSRTTEEPSREATTERDARITDSGTTDAATTVEATRSPEATTATPILATEPATEEPNQTTVLTTVMEENKPTKVTEAEEINTTEAATAPSITTAKPTDATEAATVVTEEATTSAESKITTPIARTTEAPAVTHPVTDGDVVTTAEPETREEEEATTMLPPVQHEEPCECGLVEVRKRVRGGKAATKTAYPWMVSLMFGSQSCAGSLVSSKHIMTAAHCLRGKQPPDVNIVVGAFTEQDRLTMPPVPAASFIFHPRYDMKIGNDIGIIELRDPVPLNRTSKAKTICLPKEEMKKDDDLFLIGWGMSQVASENGQYGSSVMHEAKIEAQDPDLCARLWGRGRFDSTKLCAAGCTGATKGDGGAPLSTRDGKIYQTGITAFGKAVGECGVPDLYESVFHHLSWINQVIGDTKKCLD